jgi:hypothetical protein
MKFPWLLVLVLLGITLGGLAAFGTNPLLYGVEKDPSVSFFHKNPEVLRQLAINSTTDMAPLMQDIIDTQEPVVADITIRDMEALRRDLNTYGLHISTLRSLVVTIDMNDGEIRNFLNSSGDQKMILGDLMNLTVKYDTLKAVGERNSEDRDVQLSIQSQRTALKETISALNSRYSGQHDSIMNTSTKLGLDTRAYEKTWNDIQKLVADMDVPEAEAGPVTRDESRITFLVEPLEASYRNSVQVFGVVTPAGEAREVTILLDNSRIMTVPADLKGNYFAGYTVEHIRAGEHTLVARTGNLASGVQVLTITTVASATMLTAESGLVNGTETGALCTGSVTADYPVRNAPVMILYDGQGRVDTTTRDDGTFEAFLPLEPGYHKVRAQFSDGTYPISPSRSAEVTIEVLPVRPTLDLPKTSSWNPFLTLCLAVLVLLSGGCAAFWYFRRSRRVTFLRPGSSEEQAEAVRIRKDLEEIFKESLQELPDDGSEPEKGPDITINTLLEQYDACYRQNGLSEAARQGYLAVAGTIAARLRLQSYRSLTPREMSRICRAENYGATFDHLVGIYERIRYAGSTNVKDRTGFFDRFVGIYEFIRRAGRKPQIQEDPKERQKPGGENH